MTTPRPWAVTDEGDGIYIPSKQPASGRVRWDNGIYSDHPEADAALIVEAVNAYDRLRAIEAAARVLRVETFGKAHNDDDIDAAWDVLRDALDGAVR